MIRNPRYNNVGTIDCELEHPIFGWIPFTANPNDVEEHGRYLYQQIVNGVYGPVAPADLEE